MIALFNEFKDGLINLGPVNPDRSEQLESVLEDDAEMENDILTMLKTKVNLFEESQTSVKNNPFTNCNLKRK